MERGRILLAIARAAIAQALGRQAEADDSAPWLREPGATFVTLTRRGDLRGCIGSLTALRPLREDVKANACAAAFRDPRFPALAPDELDTMEIEVSLLSPTEPMTFRDERDALSQLRPGVDGVLLEWDGYRGTFLPQVWEQLPEPVDFLAHLKRKAGLLPDFWSPTLRLSRYTVEKWKESELG